jgi:predicted Ser/Thr protein kinase
VAGCLDENTLAGLLEGALTPDERAGVDEHLDGCSDCRGVIGTMSRGVDEPRGQTIGRFLLVDVAGAGGMGVVYRAYDPELDRKVALKALRRSASSEELRARIQREAKAMARLSHPNVVTVHDVLVDGDEVYVAMEYVDGKPLSVWLREKPRTWREVLAVFVDAGRGLAAAHTAGIVHRDFKPSNVLVGDDGRARVTDFGLARVGEVDADRTGGTPAYMAPEQFRGEPTDARTDVFGFCASLQRALPSRAPARLRRIVLRGLSEKPDDRYPDMPSLLRELARDPGPTVRRAALAVALLAGFGSLAVAALRRSEPPACGVSDSEMASIWQTHRAQRRGRVRRDRRALRRRRVRPRRSRAERLRRRLASRARRRLRGHPRARIPVGGDARPAGRLSRGPARRGARAGVGLRRGRPQGGGELGGRRGAPARAGSLLAAERSPGIRRAPARRHRLRRRPGARGPGRGGGEVPCRAIRRGRGPPPATRRRGRPPRL